MDAKPEDESWFNQAGAWDGSLLNIRKLFLTPNRIAWENACRRLAFNARLSGNDVLCRVLGKYTFVVDATDVGLAPHLIADGFWEIWITCLMARQIRPGMICVDAGANVGYYTTLMADLAGAEGRVIAVEPLPANRRLLARNVHHNGFASRTQIVEAALGAASGEAQLVLPRGEPKNALLGVVDDARVASGEFEKFQVSVTSIDALNLPRLDFIKIDVEGSEEAVWAGMQQTLERSPSIQIIMEVNCQRYHDAAGFMRELGARFPLRTIDGGGLARDIGIDELLAAQTDVMLFLSNQ